MGALRIIGAAVLIAGIVGAVLYVVWLLDYEYGIGGMFFSRLPEPLLSTVAYGLVWGPLLIIIGALLFRSKQI